jgi:hypothetical protein
MTSRPGRSLGGEFSEFISEASGTKQRVGTRSGFATNIFPREELKKMERKEHNFHVELLDRAANLGVRAEFASGIVVVKTTAGDSEQQHTIIAELVKHLREVRRLVEKRSIAARGKAFVGQRVWSNEYGRGVLAEASGDGLFVVYESAESSKWTSPLRMKADAEDLVIIVDEGWDSGSSPQNDKPAVEQPRRGGAKV